MESDTPRTDAEDWENLDGGRDVDAKFCRQLERELAAMQKQRDDAQRRYCLAWVELTRLYEKLSVKEAARKFANNLGFDCFKEGGDA